MKRTLLALFCAMVFAGFASTAAHADNINDVLTSFTVTSTGANTFDFSFTGATDSGSGSFTTTSTGTAGEYLITGVSGTTNGSTITSLFAPGTFPFDFPGGADNDLYYPAIITNSIADLYPSFLDVFGFSYALANGTDVNIYYGQFATGSPEAYNFYYSEPAATPEPTSLILLGTGLLVLMGVAKMRRDEAPVLAEISRTAV